MDNYPAIHVPSPVCRSGYGWVVRYMGIAAEEAGVEPTEDAGRPPTDLKSARTTGPDTLPQTARFGRLAEHLAAAQHDPHIAGTAGRAHLIKIFENSDGQIAADT